MNLTKFLNQIDTLSSECSKEQLVSFVHDIGRTVYESNREYFLERLLAVAPNKKLNTKKMSTRNSDLYQSIIDNLDMIDNQDVSLTGFLNGEYDEWYNRNVEEIIYDDNDGIADMIEEACEFLHKCVDEENYEGGYEIGNRLLLLEILAENDEYDDRLLSIDDMANLKLINYELKQFIRDALYCTYIITPASERPEKMMSTIKESKISDITLEEVMQSGESDLPDFAEFLENWTNYLGGLTGRLVDKLYSEAVLLWDDISVESQYAEKYVQNHPGVYLDIIKNIKQVDIESAIYIGQKAIGEIPDKYVMRSKVALEMLDCISKSGSHKYLNEWCCYVVYESDTNAVNYINALKNGYADRKRELRNVFMDLKTDNIRSNLQSEREKNVPSDNCLWALKFLDCQFDEVLKKGMNVKSAFGWSSTFIKQGIALFLLLVHDGDWNDKGMKVMENIAKKEIGYSDNKVFCKDFLIWKSSVAISDNLKQTVVQTIEKLIALRTDGVMNASKRDYYGECAAFIAAIGEVRVSWGFKGAKQSIMTEYKNKYARRSAFRADMKSFGWLG